MKAMILAAGVGSRLDPLTRNVPKPMVPIVNRPVIEHIVEKLKKHGVTEIMVNLHYLGDVIKEHLGDGSKWGVKISYAQEDRLWGDAGSVKRAEEFFGDGTFLVVGGDDISDMDLTRLVKLHQDKKAVSTIALSLVDDPSEYGIVLMNERGRITRFLEKPKGEVIFSNTANTGIYVFEPEVFDVDPARRLLRLRQQRLPAAAGAEEAPVRLPDVVLLEGRRQPAGLPPDPLRRPGGPGRAGHAAARRTASTSGSARTSRSTRRRRSATRSPSATTSRSRRARRSWRTRCIGDNCVVEAGATLQRDASSGRARWSCAARIWSAASSAHGCHVKSNAAVFDGVIVDPERLAGK